MRRTHFIASAACAVTLVMGVSGVAAATAPETVNPNCFGMGASQIAQGEFEGIEGMGQHSSTQENPRLGIGNVARAFDFVHQSELADALGADCGSES